MRRSEERRRRKLHRALPTGVVPVRGRVGRIKNKIKIEKSGVSTHIQPRHL